MRLSPLVFSSLVIVLLLSCATQRSDQTGETTGSPEPFVPDSVDELVFEAEEGEAVEEKEAPPRKIHETLPGAAFRIEISSTQYSVIQLKYGSSLAYRHDSGREASIRALVARYDRVNASRSGHVIVSVYRDSGKLMKYRFVRSTYVREMDAIILKDLSSIRFSVRGKSVPSVIYITYVISVSRDQGQDAFR